jgi:hypothetical protein
MYKEKASIKLWLYSLLYLGVQLGMAICIGVFFKLIPALHSSANSGLSIVTLFVAGQITVHQFYKKHHRLITWPEINRIALICGIVYSLIILLMVGALSLAYPDKVGLAGFIIITLIVCILQNGFMYLSFYMGRRLVTRQIKRLNKAGA